jgi:hypothetical protein
MKSRFDDGGVIGRRHVSFREASRGPYPLTFMPFFRMLICRFSHPVPDTAQGDDMVHAVEGASCILLLNCMPVRGRVSVSVRGQGPLKPGF